MTGRPFPRHAVAGPVPPRGALEIDDLIAKVRAALASRQEGAKEPLA